MDLTQGLSDLVAARLFSSGFFHSSTPSNAPPIPAFARTTITKFEPTSGSVRTNKEVFAFARGTSRLMRFDFED